MSEGQSYGLALAQVAGDPDTFERIWRWTAEHLRRPDGLLASHVTSNGSVDDDSSAADADLVTAWALLRDTGPAADAHHAEGRRLAAAVLEHETLILPSGTEVLAAGDWATGAPGTLNPSYWAIPALTGLAAMTGDQRWKQLADTSIHLTVEQTADGLRLPPDWARVDGATVSATPAPAQVSDVRYSFDAQRVMAWFAVGDERARDLAAKCFALLDNERGRASALRLDGSVIDDSEHPSALVAAAAAASAAGRQDIRDHLLDNAEPLDHTHSTYYGSAWIALGRALLTTDLLK